MMALMSDEDYREINDMRDLLRHYQSLIGYTSQAVRKAIAEIREGYRCESKAMGDVMLQRADELEHHLNAIEETADN